MTIKRTVVALSIVAIGGWALYASLSLRQTLNTLPSYQTVPEESATERTLPQAANPPLIASEQGRRGTEQPDDASMASIDQEIAPLDVPNFRLESELEATIVAVEAEASEIARTTTSPLPGTSGDSDGDDLDDGAERPLAWCSREILNQDFVSDTATVWSGLRSVRVSAGSTGRNSVWQGLDATPYLGSRLGISVAVKSDGVVGLFLVVARGQESAPTGTLPWRAQTISSIEVGPGSATQWSSLGVVGDIPEDVEQIYYAVTLNGAETLWMDSVSVSEMVDLAPTGVLGRPAAVYHRGNPIVVLTAPTNLDFEQTTGDSAGDKPAIDGAYCNNIQID